MKNKWKIIVPVLVAALLAAAFYYGGNAPGAKGWEVGGDEPSVSASPQMDPTPIPEVSIDVAPGETPETTAQAEPADAPEAAAEPAPEAAPAPLQPTMEINPETGKDKYLTDPVPEGNPLPVEPQDVTIGSTAYTCTISVSCSTINDNIELCDPAKVELVPADGWILQPITVTFYEGESVFNVLQRVCKQQKIHMEFENTPIYNSAYIEGINNLYEFDVGELSGWMYKVNEWFPNYGCSRYALKNGDVINWVYTCDLGQDVGGGYAVGNK